MRKWRVTLRAAWTDEMMLYSPGIVHEYPFRWMARFRGWIWLTLNLFPGPLSFEVQRINA